jgi:hypothetical protein
VAEIRRIVVEASLGKYFARYYLEKIHHKKRAGGVAQGVAPEFRPQYHKRKVEVRVAGGFLVQAHPSAQLATPAFTVKSRSPWSTSLLH